MKFFISATTDIGTKKEVNQDSLFVRRLKTSTGPMVFAVLCDGMGGLKRGEVASAALILAFTDWMYTYLPVLSQKPIEDHVIRQQWTDVISSQNSKIRFYGYQNGCVAGTTVTALLLTEDRYFLLNIGDTRAYEVTDKAVQLTVDHTVVERKIKSGDMTREEAECSPMRNVLTRCVGVTETVSPDMFFGDTRKGAVYVLCSDGFRHQITNEEMRFHLKEKAGDDVSEMKCQEEYLVELNKQRGEIDNISVITIAAE